MGTHPNSANAGGLQSQGAKGEAVVVYCDPLATPDMESSGFCSVGVILSRDLHL
jgi:hypothetical protein